MKCSEVAAMEGTKMLSETQCHQQHREPNDDRVSRLAQIEPPDAGQQDVGHRQVEHAPQDVDRRR